MKIEGDTKTTNGSSSPRIKCISEQIMNAGKKLKVAEDETEKMLTDKLLGYDEKHRIEKDLKNAIKSTLESSFFVRGDELKAHFVKSLNRGNNLLLLRTLRCFVWSLKTGMIDPDLDIIDHCLQVIGSMPDISVLLEVSKILQQLSSYDSPNLVINSFRRMDNYTAVGTYLADKNGAAKMALALKKTLPSIIADRASEFEYIADVLNHWFVFVQRKLICPMAKKDVAELIEYFTAILLNQNISFVLGLSLRNILMSLLNFQSNSEQADYVSVLLSNLAEPTEDLTKVKKTLEMLKKLAGRGRSGIIRASQEGAILQHLIRICMSSKEKESETVHLCLHLLIMLYESPHYIEEHKALKTREFVIFLTGSVGFYDGDCIRILKFLIFNDPHNEILKEHVVEVSMKNKFLRENNFFNQILAVAKGNTSFRHKCQKLQLLTYPTLAWFVLSYSKDTFLDLCIALNGIVFKTRMFELSWMLLGFALFPLLICNIASLKNFYSATPLSIYVSLEGYVPCCRLLKYIAPWRFDNKKHVIFNLLTIFQLHPVVMVVDILSHHPQPVGNILRSQYNLKKLNCIETMLENIPCLAIKVVKIAAKFHSGAFNWSSCGHIFEIITLANSVFSLSKSALDFESIARFVDNGQWQISLFSQKASILIGYLAMIGSRMLMFLVLTRFDNWVFIFTIFLHVLFSFTVQLFTYHIKAEKDGDLDEHFVFLRKFDWRLVPFSLSEGFLVLLRSPMEYLGVYSHFQYLRKRWQFFGIYFVHWIQVVAVNLSFIFQILAKDPDNFVKERSMFIISLLSIGLHFTAGLLFAFYFFICRPKRKRTFKFVPANGQKACAKEEETMEKDGSKIPRLADTKPQLSSTSLREDTNSFAAEYRAHIDGKDCTFKPRSDTEDRPAKKKPKIKFKSVYVKI
ncbi:hypothetical protein ACHWQZ_G015970 [Mnemiopsis leidyi]